MIELRDAIKNVPLFSNISDDLLETIVSFSTMMCYDKDSILFYESEFSNQLIFLVEGLLKVYKVDKFNNEIFLYHIYKNTMISELSNLEEHKIRCFSNTVFVEKSLILAIDFKKFKKYFLGENPFMIIFINELIYKNQQLQCIINRELVFDAISKVAFMLINDLQMFNSLKRNEVAVLLHIQPETLSRVLQKLQRNNIITIDRSLIEVIKYEELKYIYNGGVIG
ncbi:MAG: Crp/Fnr family transcriptional regulator [Epsilonproteobacteria bacterium]|nr:Crp/Fnr family transcriptional regulator [Campylobacterota bacterium]